EVRFYDDDSKLLSFGEERVGLHEYNIEKNEFGMPVKQILYGTSKDFEIAPDEKHFISSGPTIWNIETGDSIQLHADPELNDMDYVAVSDNGKMLAAMSPEGRIVVWDVEKYFTPVEENPISKEKNLKIYPNPTENKINISYRIESAGMVNIFLTDILGNQTLLNTDYKFPGDYVETFNMNDFSQGIYNIILQINDKIYSESVVVMK
ncbi:MAG: T9SS type A sorting domain-containing protein, partial [bacterium]